MSSKEDLPGRADQQGGTDPSLDPAGELAAPVVDHDYPVTPVPAHARKSLFSLAVVLLGFTVFTPTMLAGAELGNAFALADLMWVILLGSVILGTYVAVLGWIGARTGLTTVVMARYTLGTSGSRLASILLGGTQIGWYGVIIGTIGELTAQAVGGSRMRRRRPSWSSQASSCASPPATATGGCTGSRSSPPR